MEASPWKHFFYLKTFKRNVLLLLLLLLLFSLVIIIIIIIIIKIIPIIIIIIFTSFRLYTMLVSDLGQKLTVAED